MAESLRQSLEMVRDDAEADARAQVEFTPIGLGTARGEHLAMTHALAKACLMLLDRIEELEAQLEMSVGEASSGASKASVPSQDPQERMPMASAAAPDEVSPAAETEGSGDGPSAMAASDGGAAVSPSPGVGAGSSSPETLPAGEVASG